MLRKGSPMYEVILFDLGRVVVGLGPSPLPQNWFPEDRPVTAADWLSSTLGQQFEKGEISSAQFAHQLKLELQLDQSEQEIVDAFTAWPTGIFPNMPAVLTALRANYHLAVLSNTNELHFPRLIDEFGIAEYFDTMFVSHHMHKAKPDPAAFIHVLEVLRVAPELVLFLDDNEHNIEVAKSLGIASVQVCGESQVIQALKQYGVLDGFELNPLSAQ